MLVRWQTGWGFWQVVTVHDARTPKTGIAQGMTMTRKSVLTRMYPEIGAGGFSSIDGTVEFYGRVSSLVKDDSVVLDFGAGRGGVV